MRQARQGGRAGDAENLRAGSGAAEQAVLRQQGGFVQFVIKDDGIGWAADRHLAGRKGKGGLGLLSMRERATYVGGVLQVKSSPRAGTQIVVRIPLTERHAAANGATT